MTITPSGDSPDSLPIEYEPGKVFPPMAKRVYEYVDQDGNTFYSFVRLPMVNIGIKLFLVNRIGVHFQNFLNFMRSMAADEPPTRPPQGQ